MSETKAKISEDVKTAMKSREQKKVTTLRGLLAEVKKQEIDTKTELNEEQLIAVVQKEVKKRRDTIKFAKEASRDDIIAENEEEIVLLQNYLGEQLSEEKLKEIISGLIESGANNIGQIMGGLNKEYKGQFEGKAASEIAKSLLG